MQTTRIVQTVALLLVMALATSCVTTNQYVSKLFAPRVAEVKDSQNIAIKFLELDSLEADKLSWVQTDITKEKDSVKEIKPIVVGLERKSAPTDEPVAKTEKPDAQIPNPQGTRMKKIRE